MNKSFLLDAIWAWQATRPKVRPDWKFATFEPEQLAQILEWQLSGLGNAEVAEKVATQFGIACRDPDLSQFWSQLSPFILASRRRESRDKANSYVEQMEKHPDQFDRATVGLIKETVFDLLQDPQLSKKETAVKTMIGAFLKLRDQDANSRRIALLEEQAEETRKVVGDDKLTPEQKQQKLRDFFGIAK